MYSVAMNWKPNHPPMSDIAPRFARTSVLERRMPSRTSGAGVRCSWTTKAARIANAAAKDRSVRGEPQPAFGASTSVNTSSSSAAVIDVAPSRSKRRAGSVGCGCRGTSRIAAISVTSASGTGRKNT
jgi:hypothetical protein